MQDALMMLHLEAYILGRSSQAIQDLGKEGWHGCLQQEYLNVMELS